MEMQKLWLMFETLPSHAKKEVFQFVESLQDKHKSSKKNKTPVTRKLSEEAFIGLWKDRDDFKDSTLWLRDVRGQEWKKK